jgi:hypothetical protein
MPVPYSPHLPRTLTNLAFLPLIFICAKNKHYHGLIFTGAMIFSFLFHLQEELHKQILFSYWHWLGLDHFFSMFAIIATCCFLTQKPNNQKFHPITWIIITIDGFLDIYFCSIPNGKYLDYKNYTIFLLFGIFVLKNYKKIVLKKIEQFFLLIGYILGLLFMLTKTTLGHSAWHVLMQFTTFILYYLQFQYYSKKIIVRLR